MHAATGGKKGNIYNHHGPCYAELTLSYCGCSEACYRLVRQHEVHVSMSIQLVVVDFFVGQPGSWHHPGPHNKKPMGFLQ